MTSKEKILNLVRQLPDDVTTEDVMEAVFFFDALEQGLANADSGKLVHDQAKRRLAKWLDPEALEKLL